ncbi:MAG: undecaprenyl-diphosphate phosphatase [Phycisphaerae bacterium]
MWLMVLAVVLGIVEGITEFIPISSTGHLIIAGNLLGFTGQKAECFAVFIQLGAILAVVVLYTDSFAGLFNFKRNVQNREQGKPADFSGLKGLLLLFLTTLPALVVGKLIHHAMKEYLFWPKPVILALAVGAIGIILAEKFKPKPTTDSLDGITPRQALLVGIFQCLSMWPGMSRAACTIVGGMLGKMDRKIAAEYSFLAAVPVMFAASAYDLYKTRSLLSHEDVPLFTVGFIVSFVVASIAIKTFIKLLQRWTLIPFAVYRLGIAALFAVLVLLGMIKFTGR